MRNYCRALWVVAIGAALGLSGCDETNGATDGGIKDGTPGTADLPPVPEGVVVLKKAAETAEADFAKAKSYLIVPYSVSETAAASISYTVSVKSAAGSELGSQSFKLRPAQRPSLDPAVLARWQQRLKVERWLRRLREEAATRPHRQPPLTTPLAGAACTRSDTCDPNEVCVDKLCKAQLTIKTSSFSATATMTADVKKKGKFAAVLVDSADSVPQGTIDALLDRYEKTVHPRAVALFGDPPLSGSSGPTASDRNGDGLVWLVLTKKVQEKQAVGFFVATDFTEDAKSNLADILYIDAAAQADSVYGILAHELQHLLSYGSKVYKAKVAGGAGALEALWLDEGQAHFAEDACGFGGENTTLLRQQVFPDFSDKSLLASQDDLSVRGMAFLFVRYLFEQKGAVSYQSDGGIEDKGGAAFLKALHTSSKQGVAAINESIAPTFADFKTAFDNWIAAVSLDGRGFTQFPRYIYQPLIVDPVTSQEIGVKIRGARKDNTGTAVKLEGPNEEDLPVGDTDGVIPNASGRFYLLSNQTGKVNVSVTTDEQDFRFAVIRLQ